MMPAFSFAFGTCAAQPEPFFRMEPASVVSRIPRATLSSALICI
jgi:hypothetical protein